MTELYDELRHLPIGLFLGNLDTPLDIANSI